ncbi:MAG: ABC transporter ATP-binding protein [Candidatus Brocadiia bacterium]
MNERTLHRKLSAAPQWVQDRVDGHLQPEERIKFCFVSDMEMQGAYVPEALVVSDRRIFAVNRHREGIHREVPIQEMALVTVKRYMGNGILLLTTWQQNVRALRFSSSLISQVTEFKDKLGEYLADRLCWNEPDEHEEKLEHRDAEEVTAEANEDARQRCPQCGQLLPPRMQICNACLDKRTVLRRLLSFLGPYKALLAVTITFTVSLAGLQVVVPRLTRNIIRDAIEPGDVRMLGILVGIVAGLFFVRAILAAVRRVLNAKLAQNVIYDLRQAVYSHLQRLSMSYHDRQSTGRLISRVVSDSSRLQRFAVGGLQQFLVDVLVMSIILVWMFLYSVPLTLILWIPVPIYYFLIRWYRRHVHKVFRKAFRKRAAMSGHLSDTIPGIDMVKAFSQEQAAIDKFNYYSDGFRAERIKATHFSARFTAAFLLLTQMGMVLIYWFGGRSTILGTEFGVAELVMFIGWVGMINAPVRRFARLTEQMENAATSAERVFDVLDTEADISGNEDGHQVEGVEEHVQFEDVSFSYDSGPAILKDISFSVEPGETIGIVGPSGSGKSTLIKLICRFYDISGGRILVDGRDIREVNLASYRSQLSIVGQEPFLFRDTILENIRYGKPEATRENVVRAAKVANAHEFIMRFPEAYDTDARERGNRFSGGEKQRICIARAVLKDPNILILDEATSSVDTKNEKLIQNALDRLIEDRTAFIIAHRLSTLRNADRIIMMREGEIVDIASHATLMKRCTPYRELVEAQKDFGGEAVEKAVA